MKLTYWLWILVFPATSQCATAKLRGSEECLVPTRDGLPMNKQPLYIVSGKLANPVERNENSYLAVASGKALNLYCVGTNSNLNSNGQSSDNAECNGGSFYLGGKVDDLKDVTCTGTISASLMETTKKCGTGDSRIINIGFKVGQKFQKLFHICHNYADSVTIFAEHTVSRLIEIGNQKDKNRPQFKKGLDHLFKGINPAESYKKSSQEAVFNNYFDGKYLSDKEFLNKGHLAPDADFIFSAWQYATYFYVNAAPQWNTLNSGYWLGIEKAVRNFATQAKKDIRVVTGTYGILQLEDGNGVLREVYLESETENLPVPRVFWKAVHDASTGSSIVFIGENTPIPESFDKSEMLCRDVCDKAGWSTIGGDQIDKGMVYCCELTDAKESIPYIPISDKDRKLLAKSKRRADG